MKIKTHRRTVVQYIGAGCIAACLALTASSVASATTPVGGAGVVKALKLAQAHFDATPNCSGGGGVYVASAAEFAAIGYPDGVGYAEWVGEPINTCVIWLRDNIARGEPSYGWAIYVCTVITHEYGHLIRLGHRPDEPRSVMYPKTRYRYPTRGCYDSFIGSNKANFANRYGSPIFVGR